MEKIAEDVWQLRGYPRHYFNVFMIGDVLIDAGTRWARRRIMRQVKGKPPSLIALTHCHPDHQGAAKAVREHFGVPLACHEGDVPAMEGWGPMLPDDKLIRFFGRFWAGPPCPVDRLLHEGDDLAGFRVVPAPGHTPGHVLFFREADRVCIAGDVLANIHFITGKVGLREPPPRFCVDVAQNRRSIRILAELKPRVVCFGHGPPLRDPELLEQFLLRRGHDAAAGRVAPLPGA